MQDEEHHDTSAGGEHDRDETPTERADRNLNELLQELRVAIPGVQVLFAFLLTVPFAQRFARVTEFQESLYFATLLASVLASVLLIAPTPYHRLNFGQRDKRHIVKVANAMALAGLTVLAIAMTGAVLLITDVLFGQTATVVTGIGVGTVFAVLWFAVPLRRRMINERH
jgi:cation transport ATPase